MPRGATVVLFCALAGVYLCASAAFGWSEPQSPFRRSLEVPREGNRINGDESVLAEFYAPGLARPDGSDVRIAAEDGKLVPMRLVRGGGDDRVVVVFNPTKSKARYYAYWGDATNKTPPPTEATINSGLLVESKRSAGGRMDSTQQMQQVWERSGEIVGRGMISRAFVGYQPARLDGATISRITGVLYAPTDGEYQIALTADDRGGLKIDGADAVFAPGSPQDTRFNAKLQLKRGPHAIEYFHFDAGGDWRFTIGWRRPDSPRIEVIESDAFGRIIKARAGSLEQLKKEVVVDLTPTWLGECVVAERSSYRIRFEATAPEKSTGVRIAWSFGDGQTAAGSKVDHVFLAPGVYDVTLDLKTTQGSDKRTWKFRVERDPERVIDPALDDPALQCDGIENYDFDPLTPIQQAVAARLLARGKKFDPLPRAISALCATRKHPDQQWAVDALDEAVEALSKAHRESALPDALAKLPADSNLHPKAADLHADVLLWRLADFKRAAEMLETFKNRESNNLKRLQMQALLLDGRVEEAKKIMARLPVEPDVGKRVAISGALARSIEYFIDHEELDAASDRWDDWQRRYPESFWEGYSMVLKVRMLESRYPQSAAKIAEAFALAAPTSPYAPQLLDRASRIMAGRDKTKSDALRKLLKEKYPEDPLSQER